MLPFDLHVLGTPPAFVLSQDQTLKKLYLKAQSSKIKVLNNLLLAKLLKNFRWLFLFALIHELLNKSINLSKVFKFVFTLFNLQGTDFAASLSLTAFRLYHISFHLSRTFFKFLSVFSSCEVRSLLAEQLRYVSTSSLICQELFSNSFQIS